MKDLNEKVERAIDKTQTKRILAARNKTNVDVQHRARVKDKELENAQQQLDSYKAEIASLKAKIDEISQVGKMIDTEQEIRENNQVISDLKKMIRDKEQILTNLEKSDDPSYKISNMINEIRMWKEKIQKKEELFDRNDSTEQMQAEKLVEIENENNELMNKIQSIDSKIEIDPGKAKDPSKSREIEKLNEEVKAKKEKLEEKQKENEKELKQLQKKISEIEAERDMLYTKAKELGQEQRISTLKLREVGRLLKHNQLNPIAPIRANHNISSRQSDTGSKKTLSKRGSTTNLLESSKNKKSLGATEKKSLKKGDNTKSTQLLNKKQYSKPSADSDDDLEKNQVIDYDKFNERQKKKSKGK